MSNLIASLKENRQEIIQAIREGMIGLEMIQDFNELYSEHSMPINDSQTEFASKVMELLNNTRAEFGLERMEIDYKAQIRWTKGKKFNEFTDKYSIGDSVSLLQTNFNRTIFLNASLMGPDPGFVCALAIAHELAHYTHDGVGVREYSEILDEGITQRTAKIVLEKIFQEEETKKLDFYDEELELVLYLKENRPELYEELHACAFRGQGKTAFDLMKDNYGAGVAKHFKIDMGNSGKTAKSLLGLLQSRDSVN